MKKGKLFLALAVLALVSGILVGRFGAEPVAADNTTYLVVYHKNIYGTSVATDKDTDITVEARPWPGGGSWTDVTSTGQSEYTCNEGTHGWKYSTTLSGAIQFRVTVTGGKSGTKCGGGATSYVDDDVLYKIVSESSTGSITAGWYYP
jgi:hypothetical protein